MRIEREPRAEVLFGDPEPAILQSERKSMTNVTAKPRATHNIVAALICMAAIVVALSLLLIPPQGVLAQPEDSGAPPDQKTADGESAGSPGHSGLLRKAEHEGSVRVIVGLKTGFTPEGRLSRSRVAGQRKNIATSRSSVLADLRGKGYRTMRQFETLPYVALELSPEALEKAQNSPNVTTIHEDIAMRPAL